MSSVKVRDLAKEFNKKSKDFIKLLYEFGIRVKSENTRLDLDTVQTIRDLFNDDNDYMDEQITKSKTVSFTGDPIKIADFAVLLDCPIGDVLGVVLKKGLFLNINSVIDVNLAKDIAQDLSIPLTLDADDEFDMSHSLKNKADAYDSSDESIPLKSRPPVITVMGHVDHGKTLLLDNIRSTSVVDGESGGITQHIGAYQVRLKNKKKMTFLDTPGHAAFTALRSRGVQVTDIVVLVVAADDGIKPQTVEAINHAKSANTPVIVAVNKMDLPAADMDRVKQQLTEYDLVSEEWGGSTIVCPISAKTGDGLDNLLDMIQLTADVEELKAAYDGLAKAIVIEAFLDKQRGPVASILVTSGTLNIGGFVTVGGISGKVRAMYNDTGQSVKMALPSTPVEILGLSSVPTPGDVLKQHQTERLAKKAALDYAEQQTQQKPNITRNVSLDRLSEQINDGDVKQLNLIIKTDMHGSLEALVSSIDQIQINDISIHVIHAATGNINENDILLATASQAVVIGFRVQVTSDAQKEGKDIDIRLYDVIYDILNDIESMMSGMKKTVWVETKVGEADVREIFKFSKVGVIAGCYVTSGYAARQAVVAVRRNGDDVFKGPVGSIKRFKDTVKRVDEGYECGVVIDGFSEFEAGDIIDFFEVKEG